MNKRDKLLNEREQRMIGYVREGLTSQEIGLREGLESDNANRMRNEVSRKHGIKRPAPKTMEMPFGITDKSWVIRKRLGDHLWHLALNQKLHKLEIARDIGVPQRQQGRAEGGKYNWSLSEMERLANALNIPFEKFMQELVK